ncbi:MAG: GAF domain-containing protein [bacterium]|nr:GAF domain-containing protein [bacterium]MCP5067613.1 GAF domain-containing protein [bacterium]
MRRAITIYGITDETLTLIPILEDNPEIEIRGAYDPDLPSARERAAAMHLELRLTDDLALFGQPLHALIDAGTLPPFAQAHPELAQDVEQILSPLTARLLWGYGVSSGDRKGELLQALHEIVESVNLTVEPQELFGRMLEIAMSVTGADGGSLMLVDPDRGDLAIRVAVGVERELWPKIRVPLGEGIAGKVAAEGRPIKLRGHADRADFQIVRERFDLESALCVPLIHEGRVLGVLNLHHATRADAFDDDDLEFAEQLGRLDADIIHRAQEHETLRREASRYAAVREVRESLASGDALDIRMRNLCQLVARRAGGGIANAYLYDSDEDSLRWIATSLGGAGLGADWRVESGDGIDGRAARSRQPMMLHGADGCLAYAALPLLAGGELVGLLAVQAGAPVPRSRSLEEALLEMAAAAAEAVAQAEREARMSSHATKVTAINEAGIRLISSREISEVTRLATSSGALILEADHAVLRLQDPETRRYVIRSYYGSGDGRTQEALFQLDKRIAVSTLKTRQPRLVRKISDEPALGEVADRFQSVLSAPLRRESRVIGTLSLYDKVAPDQFYAGPFNEDDLRVFSRYGSYVERALENALYYESAGQHRNFDEETGLPNEEYLTLRLEQELARAGSQLGRLAIAICRIENLDEVRRDADGVRADRLVQETAQALREPLRDFDVLTRTGEAEFTMLLPDPGPAPEDRITALSRAVADRISRDDRLNQPVHVTLAFGYAIHPTDGTDRQALLKRAAHPRIRMI